MDSGKWAKTDSIVISTYWSSEFLHCVVAPWVEKHGVVFSDKTKYSGIALQHSVVFFSQYILALFLALHVDLNNHKLEISAVAMLIYLTIPLFGIVLRSWAAAQLMLMRCGLSAHVIVKAVRLNGIFQQPPERNGDNSGLTITMNETLVSVVKCVVYFVLRNDPRELSLISSIMVWFNLFIAILSVLIAHYVIRNMVRKQTIEEDTVAKIIEGIKLDPRGKQYKYLPAERAHSAIGLGMFLAVVFMFSAVSMAEVIINNAYKLEDGTSGVSEKDRLIASVVELCIIPLVGLLFSLFKGKFAIIAEGALLAFVYISSIVSLYVSVISRRSPTPTVTSMNETKNCVVDPGFLDPNATALFYDIAENVGPISVEMLSTFYDITEVSPYHRPHINLQSNEVGIDITTRIYSKEKGGLRNSSRSYNPRTQYYTLLYKLKDDILFAQYHISSFTPTDGKNTTFYFLYHLNDEFPIDDDDPKMVIASQGIVVKEVESSALKKGFIVNVTVPRYSSYTISCVDCACGESQTFNWTVHKSVSKIFFYTVEERRYKDTDKRKPYCHPVYSSYILAGANCTEYRNPTLVTTSFAFKSVALTGALVSYINFYWNESPYRLCTTTLAAAIAVNDVLVALTNYVFPYVTDGTTYWFMFLTFIAGLIHVPALLTYLYYYTKGDIDLDLKDDSDDSVERSISPTLFEEEDDVDDEPSWWKRFSKNRLHI